MKNTKTVLLLLLLAVLTLGLTACGSDSAAPAAKGEPATSQTMPTIINTAEYVLYQNIFYNDYGKNELGKTAVKSGIFATLTDAWNSRTRYYVWGYNDNTRCCDWQWEFIPKEGTALPANGSKVRVSGVFAESEDALDGYWIVEADVSTDITYTGPNAELDMAMMSDTLERVQVANIVRFPEQFEGKTYSAFGTIGAMNTLDDPYYANSWTIPFTSDSAAPEVGSESLLRGTIAAGTLANASFGTRTE